MDIGYRVNTDVLDDGQIVQETVRLHGDVRETVMRQIMDISDEQIRQALISIGWTPPVGGVPDGPIFVVEFLRLNKEGHPELVRNPLSEWPSWAGGLRDKLFPS